MLFSVSAAVKKYLEPIMMAHGYSYEAFPGGDVWEFVKQGEKEQRVLVDRYHPKTLRLDFRLIPSYRHHHLEIGDDYWNRHKRQNALLGGWEYRNQKELAEIIQLFAVAMEEVGFAIMEESAADPLDITPAVWMEQDLYQNYQTYSAKWAEEAGVSFRDSGTVFPALVKELLALKEEGLEKLDQNRFLYLAAAYGKVFEQMDFFWEIQEQERTLLKYPEKLLYMPTIYPLTHIYHFWHFGKPEHAMELMENDIKSYKFAMAQGERIG